MRECFNECEFCHQSGNCSAEGGDKTKPEPQAEGSYEMED